MSTSESIDLGWLHFGLWKSVHGVWGFVEGEVMGVRVLRWLRCVKGDWEVGEVLRWLGQVLRGHLEVVV